MKCPQGCSAGGSTDVGTASCIPNPYPLVLAKLGAVCTADPKDCPVGQHCVDFEQVASGDGRRCIADTDGGDDCSAIECPTGQPCSELESYPGILQCGKL
jgi:hypothetical protein